MRLRRWIASAAAASLAAAVALHAQPRPHGPTAATFAREIPWAGKGVWLRADLHAHTKFSDGNHTPDELIAKAAEFGCDVSAITDHADADLKAATPEYMAAIAAARTAHPEVTVIAGMEWNIPPGKGNDHVTMLIPSRLEDVSVLSAFKTRFDDLDKKGENPELADEALRWMAATAGSGIQPALFLNHPSRKVKASGDVLPWLTRWRGINTLFVGMEGAPGHQHQNPLGAYGKAVKPIERWDPVSAEVGGVWDQLLASGTDLWGASATSDFHSWGSGDYWPCQFSETRIYARARTGDAVIQALRAGSYYGVHGRIVSDAALTVSADGLPRGAIPGESIRVAAGQTITATLSATVPAEDWQQQPNALDRLELIAIDRDGARVAAAATEAPVSTVTSALTVPDGGLVVRGRGCHSVSNNEPGLCFYTNPIRIVTRRATAPAR